MGSLILVMQRQLTSEKIAGMLKTNGFDVYKMETSGAAVLSHTHQLDCGVVIASVKMSDMFINEFASFLPKNFALCLLATGQDMPILDQLVSDIDLDESRFKVLKMPLSKQAFLADLMSLMQAVENSRISKPFKKKLRRHEDDEVISKAKAKLMQTRAMSEPEAHRFIQKYAMDNGMALVDFAKKILESEI